MPPSIPRTPCAGRGFTRTGAFRLVAAIAVSALLLGACSGADEPTKPSDGMFAENRAGTAIGDLVARAGSPRVTDVTITADEVRLATDQGALFIQPREGEVYTTRGAGDSDAPTFDATAWDLAALGEQLRSHTPAACPETATARLRPLVPDRPVLELSCPDPAQRPTWLEPDGSELPDLDLTDPDGLAAGLVEQQENIEGGIYSVTSFTTDGRQRLEVIRKDGDKAVRVTRHAAYRPTIDQLYDTLPWERPDDYSETFELDQIKPQVVADTIPKARARAGASETVPAEIRIGHPLETEAPVVQYFFGEDEVWYSLDGEPIAKQN
ncbi:hypothetical protein ACQCX2_00405 [Propionibacteriaceae bacterium Y1700]|uniref:hypothetical protein n=1 Tax=Microlunatus sp. Y1700 TaxID=3418487 RepID=UPI003DA70339